MGPVGVRGFGVSVKFADGKTSSANVPHLNVWGFDISAAEFPQQKKLNFVLKFISGLSFSQFFIQWIPNIWEAMLWQFRCKFCSRALFVTHSSAHSKLPRRETRSPDGNTSVSRASCTRRHDYLKWHFVNNTQSRITINISPPKPIYNKCHICIPPPYILDHITLVYFTYVS